LKILPGRPSVSVSAAEQLEILRRGVDAITPESDFTRKLEKSVATGTPLRVKYGIDPTGIDVHLGHTVPLRKLRQFQDLGHTAVIIIGNYTALVGDPSGRDEARVALTEEQVNANARDYLTQVGKIIDLDRAEVHHNGDWFSKWSFLDVLNLTRRMTLGQISAREDFAKRISEKKPVYLHECLYPLMQGWDSVEIKSDVELGGTEQLFSLLVARDLQQSQGLAGQVAITMPILVGTDGIRKMGKSLSNYIGVNEPSEVQFGKVMSLPDGPMRQYFTLLTDLPISEIDRLLSPGVNPRNAKEVLGKKIVAQYVGSGSVRLQGSAEASSYAKGTLTVGAASEQIAEAAAEAFRNRAKGIDLEVKKGTVSRSLLGPDNKVSPGLLLKSLGLAGSTSEGGRLVEQGAVKLGPDRTPMARDKNVKLEVLSGLMVTVGSGNKAKSVVIEVVEDVSESN
jgi:tyrosyl-tRNA synthetase